MNCWAPGSIPLDGSSKKTSEGLPTSAMPSDNLRLLPPLSVPAGESAYWVSDSLSSSDTTSRRTTASSPPPTNRSRA